MSKKTILLSGGDGRLAQSLCREAKKLGHSPVPLSHLQMDVTDVGSVERAIHEIRPNVFIHTAAVLTEEDRLKMLQVNICGSVNVVCACSASATKLIYISTDYVYSNHEVDHTEDDALLPFTVYGWTKLGGECAVMAYEHSLIVRGAFSPVPFRHTRAFCDVRKNMIYQDRAAELIVQLLDARGIVNVAERECCSLFDFAKRTRPNVEPATSPPEYQPKESNLSTKRLDQLLSAL
jgi:dTDP-4-dehydrorhamnose reductase